MTNIIKDSQNIMENWINLCQEYDYFRIGLVCPSEKNSEQIMNSIIDKLNLSVEFNSNAKMINFQNNSQLYFIYYDDLNHMKDYNLHKILIIKPCNLNIDIEAIISRLYDYNKYSKSILNIREKFLLSPEAIMKHY